MKKLLCHIIFFILAATGLFAQTTYVPDSNLRKVLVNSYGSYLDTNDYVVDAKAATYTGVINCSGQNINDLTGVWKFTGITSLVCQYNALSNLDSLGKFSNLSSLYCYHNKLTRLPDMLGLAKLSYLSCNSNQLSNLPDLSMHVPLTYLDCSDNKISSLKGLDKLVNLLGLYLYRNQLDSLPDLSKLSKLQILQCQGNNLRTLPGLSQLTQLSQLVAGSNKFDSLPDMKGLTKLTILLLYDCGLSKVPNIGNMKNLSQLILAGNKITSIPNLSGNPILSILKLDNNLLSKLPDISACKSTLNVFKVNNNQLDSLPNFSLFTTFDSAYVQNNRLTFEDVIPLVQDTTLPYINYAPQDSVGARLTSVVTEIQPCLLVLGIDKKLSSNQYTWLKNGKKVANTSTDTLSIPRTQLGDSGIYTCQITNSLAPLLTLYSRAVRLKVTPCLDLSAITYTTTDYDCNVGGTVTLTENNTIGGQKPYSYKLVGTETGSVRYPFGNSFSNLFENAYTLEVKDQQGCKALYPTPIVLKGKKGSECKHLVLLGNDNSSQNSLFLEEKGAAKVYDNEGQLVQTFNTPGNWDGKNKNGEFLPGYYVIDLNGKMLNVTLIK